MEGTATIIDVILAVFSAVAEWFVEIIPVVISLFYSATSGLTFLGYLAIIALAISVVFLLNTIGTLGSDTHCKTALTA